MTTPDPFDAILDQIADLISFTQKKKKEAPKGEVNDEVKEQLNFLEQQVELFKHITDEALKITGLTNEDLEKTDDIDKKQQRLIERTKKMKLELSNLEQEFRGRGKFQKIKDKKKKDSLGNKRKKKFKRLGGQGWTPI